MAADAPAPPVPVRHAEGLVHGFLALRSLTGADLATGDLTQIAAGDRVTVQVVFHFKDGSVQDETAVYTQRSVFRLVSDHLIQKGPTFPTTLDMMIDQPRGQVVVKYKEPGGAEKTATEHMTLPDDLANGIIPTILKNVRAQDAPVVLSFVAATPKPQLVKLNVSSAGQEPFSTDGQSRQAAHFVVKVEIGGLSGMFAPLVGKQPPDSHLWILEGPAPAFVRSEALLYVGGPQVRIELVSPRFPKDDVR